MLSTRFYFCIVLTLILCKTYAQPNLLRTVFLEDPSTKIAIVFNTSNSPDTSPLLFYGTDRNAVFNNTSAVAYRDEILSNNSKGMYNNFVKLTGLIPGTTYYFKVKDNTGETPIYYFETIPDNPNERLSFVAGGDSRSNRLVRQQANTVVSKLKPHAVFFDGDFTDSSTDDQWQQWIDDWQLTVSDDGRITPLVVARGNHENNNAELTNLFGTNSTATYALSFGGNLFKAYTLNSENTIIKYASQTDWLKQQLVNDQDYIFKFAQYHKPMRPHTRLKLDGAAQYAYWAPLFYQYNVDLVLESSAHTANTTLPIIPCTGGFGCKDGFKEDALNGTVYTGQGTWGAPLRPSDDKRSWTFYGEMINQFKLIFVDKEKMELRTISYENSLTINEVDVNNRFELPIGLSIEAGINRLTEQPQDVLIIPNKKGTSYPKIEIALPEENAIYYNQVNVDVVIKNLTSLNNINSVVFLLDGVNKGLDTSAPFSFRFDESEFNVPKTYEINAIAYDVNGIASPMVSRRIKVLSNCNNTASTQLEGSYNDAEQLSNGRVDLGNYDLDMGYNGTMCGLRFTNINLPPNVTILNANIQFTADERKLNPTDLIFYGEDNANSAQFLPNTYDISSRTKVPVAINWPQVPNWESVGDSGPNQKTPNLKNIVQYLVNKPGWHIESPITFIIEGNGYRVSETFDSDSIATPILTVQYSCNRNYANVWPGDADNNGIVNAKDVLYICLADGLQGYARPNASTNWQAQQVIPWANNIGGINNAHQDTNGDGVANLNDIDVVDENYGLKTAAHLPLEGYSSLSLSLKPIPSDNSKEEVFALVLNNIGQNRIMAHGISGSIDMSNIVTLAQGKFSIDSTFNAVFDPDKVYTKYDPITQTLHYAISKTDGIEGEIKQNEPLLRILISIVDILEGGADRSFGINNSGIICADGKYKPIHDIKSHIINSSKSSIIKDNTQPLEGFVLNIKDWFCDSPGWVELQVPEYNEQRYTIKCIDISDDKEINNLYELQPGEYELQIEFENGSIGIKTFIIKDNSSIEDILLFEYTDVRPGVYKATEIIHLNNGVEIKAENTVELSIQYCE